MLFSRPRGCKNHKLGIFNLARLMQQLTTVLLCWFFLCLKTGRKALIIKNFANKGLAILICELRKITPMPDIFMLCFLEILQKYTQIVMVCHHLPFINKFYFDFNCSRLAKSKNSIAQRGARTHDPKIKSLMLYRLS